MQTIFAYFVIGAVYTFSPYVQNQMQKSFDEYHPLSVEARIFGNVLLLLFYPVVILLSVSSYIGQKVLYIYDCFK